MYRTGIIAALTLALAFAAGSDALGRSLKLRAPHAAAQLPTAKGADYSATASKILARGMSDGLTARIKLGPEDKSRVARLSLRALQSEPFDAVALRNLGWDPLESTCRHASLSIL